MGAGAADEAAGCITPAAGMAAAERSPKSTLSDSWAGGSCKMRNMEGGGLGFDRGLKHMTIKEPKHTGHLARTCMHNSIGEGMQETHRHHASLQRIT